MVVLMLLLALLSMPASVAQVTDQEPTPMFRMGPDNTGVVNGGAPLNGTVLWTTEVDSGVLSSPVVTGGRVYVGTMAGEVLCLNAYSGSVQWSYDTGMAVESSPAVLDGRVYIGSDDRHVYCLDADDGTLIWRYETGGEVKSSPAVVDGRLYVGSNDFKVYCLDAEDGTEMWNFSTGGYVYSSPAVSGGRVYFGSCDGIVYCVRIGNGDEVWTFEAEYIPAAPALWRDLVILGTYDDHVYYLDGRTGEEVLNVSGDFFDIYASAAVVESGDEMTIPEPPTSFVTDGAGEMLVIGPDGELEDVSFPKGGSSSPLLIRNFPREYDHLLVYGSDDGFLHAKEYRNPNIIRPAIYEPLVEWDVELGIAVKSSPFAYHDKVYVGAERENGKGAVACIGEWDDSAEPYIVPRDYYDRHGVLWVEAEVKGDVQTTGVRVLFDDGVHDADPIGGVWRTTLPISPPFGWRNVTIEAYDAGGGIATERAMVYVFSIIPGAVEVVIDSPSNGTRVEGVVLVTGRVISNYSIGYLHVFWDEEPPVLPDLPNGEYSEGNWTAALETVDLKHGLHTINAIAITEGSPLRGNASIRVKVVDEADEKRSVGFLDIVAALVLIAIFVALLLTKPPRVPEGSSPERKPPGKV